GQTGSVGRTGPGCREVEVRDPHRCRVGGPREDALLAVGHGDEARVAALVTRGLAAAALHRKDVPVPRGQRDGPDVAAARGELDRAASRAGTRGRRDYARDGPDRAEAVRRARDAQRGVEPLERAVDAREELVTLR